MRVIGCRHYLLTAMEFFTVLALLVSAGLAGASQQVDSCPIVRGCDPGQCITDLSQDSCPEVVSDEYQFVFQWKELCQCCPRCVKMLKYNAPCKNNILQCSPGLQCSDDKCQNDEKNCWSSHYYDPDGVVPVWLPRCLPDGSYDPVQCKGRSATGRCFCSDVKGTRIFGQQWWKKAENMTCACSRRVEELRALREDVTLHCDREGNFETLQCDDGVCWCAETKTGRPESTFVPETMVKMLPCYEVARVGSQYLRMCESVEVVQHRIRAEMTAHGTVEANMPAIQCDRDGSYGKLGIKDMSVYCRWRNNTNIRSYQATIDRMYLMNCNCARDAEMYEEIGEVHSLFCGENGNYLSKQLSGDKFYCVDSDGFPNGLQDCEMFPPALAPL